MSDDHYNRDVKDHWDCSGLSEAILSALKASGKKLDALSLDDLAPFDQFHGGGRRFTLRLARLAGLKPGSQVLDVGGGLGGAARTLALEFGCRLTVVDLTEVYVQAGRMLTGLMRLDNHVTSLVGDGFELPFEAASFDVIWTQNSGMNAADKERLYAGFYRLLRPGGLLVTQEMMSGPNQPPVFPVMWSRDGANHFLRSPDEMQALIEAAGFRKIEWQDVTAERGAPGTNRPKITIQSLVMGDELLSEIRQASRRNQDEKRLVMVQAVFDKPSPGKVVEILTTEEDAPFALGLLNEPSFIRFIGDRGVRTVADARDYLLRGPMASYQRFGFGLYLVELKHKNIPIGMCGLIKREFLNDVDIGYAFLPEYWSRGYALEAASTVMAYGREVLGLTRIVAVVTPDNARSIGLLRKLGLDFERAIIWPEDGAELQLYATGV